MDGWRGPAIDSRLVDKIVARYFYSTCQIVIQPCLSKSSYRQLDQKLFDLSYFGVNT